MCLNRTFCCLEVKFSYLVVNLCSAAVANGKYCYCPHGPTGVINMTKSCQSNKIMNGCYETSRPPHGLSAI